MKNQLIWMLMLCAVAECKSLEEQLSESKLFVRILGEQLSGEVADYENSSPEWKLRIEARIRHVMFTYWVCVDKFKYDRNEMIEVRFGEIVEIIKKNGAFVSAFKMPHFIAGTGPFPPQVFKSDKGERFEINSIQEFELENDKFIKFIENCRLKNENRGK